MCQRAMWSIRGESATWARPGVRARIRRRNGSHFGECPIPSSDFATLALQSLQRTRTGFARQAVGGRGSPRGPCVAFIGWRGGATFRTGDWVVTLLLQVRQAVRRSAGMRSAQSPWPGDIRRGLRVAQLLTRSCPRTSTVTLRFDSNGGGQYTGCRAAVPD